MGHASLLEAAQDSEPDGIFSVLGQHWRMRPHDARHALAIAQSLGVPDIIGRVLAARGVRPDQAEAHLSPTLRTSLPDPFHLKDMRKAAEKLTEIILAGPGTPCPVAVLGDYDVDGATSSALLVRYFRALGFSLPVHIPDRMREGYGPNIAALLGLQAQGARVVITVDCGTMAFAPLKAAREVGLEVIVVDHHKGEAALPDAFAVVNPNRQDETSPHTGLAACGVVFLLLVAVNRLLRDAGRKTPDLLPLLDLVALGTICDVMPLTGVNRALVAQGLKIMTQRGNAGINAAMETAKLAEAPGTYHAGFIIGPRINAGGRVGQSDLGVRLLATDDPHEAQPLAEALDRFNAERKAIESLVLDEAMEAAAQRPETDAMLIVAREGWHPGVIGIVAGRLKDYWNKPTAVIALENGTGKASARSVAGIDLGAAVIAAVQAGVLLGGGGHAMAAGFSVAAERVETLRAFMDAYLGGSMRARSTEHVLHLDGTVSVRGVTVALARTFEQAGPFGMGNPSVRLMLKSVRIVNSALVGENHIRAVCVDAGPGAPSHSLKAMAFRAAGTALGDLLLRSQGCVLHIAGQARINLWQGRESVDFFIDDAASA